MPDPVGVSDEQQSRLQTWLRLAPGAKPAIYRNIFIAASIDSPSYWLEIVFAAGIATFGLVENSPAVIIGAMLISPLMGPIMATGLALAIGDLYLGVKALLNLLTSIAASIALSGGLVWILPFHSATAEITSRTKPNLLDLGIALLSGLAGSIVVCRGSGDGVTALPGVAIAVALMPPLCVMGFGLGSGADLEIMGGAGLLFLTNLVAIVASAFLVFLLVRIPSPDVQRLMQSLRGDDRFVRRLSQGRLARILATGGQLHWRILMILVLLASIAVPLRRALLEVANETFVRGVVETELRQLSGSTGVVSEQVDLGQNEIAVRLVSTQAIPASKVSAVQQDLKRRTGRDVQITTEAVASRSELAGLLERLNRPAPAAPKPETLLDLQANLWEKVQPAVQAIWPSADVPLEDFEVTLNSASGLTVTVRYQASRDLGKLPSDLIQQSLREKLGLPDLVLKTERIPPAKQPRPSH